MSNSDITKNTRNMQINISNPLIIGFLLLFSYSFTQKNTSLDLNSYDTPKAVIANIEFNSLYRNYSNKFEILVEDKYDSTWILIENGIIENIENSSFWIIPGAQRETKINLMGKIKDSIFQINMWNFRVSNLPSPQLYLGSIDISNINSHSESAFYAMTRFFAKYPPEIYLNESFTILEWEIEIEGTTYYGKGSSYTEEVKDVIYNLPKGRLITFSKFRVKGSHDIYFDLEPKVNYIKKNDKPINNPYRLESPCKN